MKGRIGGRARVNLAVFDANTNNEIVVDSSVGGRTTYKNAPQTSRKGVELSADALAQSDAEKSAYGWDYLYEPDAATVIDELLTRYLEALIYQAVAENMASEQSARMVAMKAATDNAGTLIGELKLIYNKTRQAAITKELSEIVSGAAAISG